MERDQPKFPWSLMDFLLGNGAGPSRIDQLIVAQQRTRVRLPGAGAPAPGYPDPAGILPLEG
jgi:hypothetical protein